MIVLNDLLEYKNLKIYQDNKAFVFSLDSVLLPNFIKLNKNVKRILDIGCGNAPMPLILSTKTDAKIFGVEIQKKIADLAKKSVKLNKLDNQIEIINDDIKNIDFKEKFDIIISNPPYFKVSKYLSLKEEKLIARHEVKLDLETLIKISANNLKNNGVFAIVHRPVRLSEIIILCSKYNLEVKRIEFVYPNLNKEANMVLIEAIKGANPGLKVLEPIITHENGKYTDQIKKYFRGE